MTNTFWWWWWCLCCTIRPQWWLTEPTVHR